jgi:excisionase family DNA binding protein
MIDGQNSLSERVLTVPEAARLLRVGVRTYYAAAARGDVPAVRIGRRIVVPGALLERFLAGGGFNGTGGRQATAEIGEVVHLERE